MIIDRSHRNWIFGTAAVAVAGTLLYSIYASTAPGGPRGGSVPGLIFGFTGTGLIVFECLLGARKKFPASPLGRVTTWLKAHVWLGALSTVLILLHSGWRWGHGLSGVLMWFFLVITLSGVLGLVLQRYIPGRMTELCPRETVYEQIPRVIRQLRVDADERVEFVTADLGLPQEEVDEEEELFRAGGVKFYFDPAQRKGALEKIQAEAGRRKAAPQIVVDEVFTGALREQYLQEIRPYLTERASRHAQVLFRNDASVKAYFNHLRTLLPETTHEVLADLESIVEERRQMGLQQTMHHWLHGWLLVHMPLSMAFLALILVHALMSLRY